MPHIMILIDGMQDVAYPELGGKTPYEFGRGESIRAMEASGAAARIASTPEGFEPDTKDNTLTLLGVRPGDIPKGRSYIEALAEGVEVGDDDLVMRCNFVKISPDGRLEVPTCSAPEEAALPLLAAVRARGDTVKPVGTYKSLQVVKGGRKYAGMTTFPPHNYSGGVFEELLPRGNALADRLAALSREQLGLHAPYTVLNWGQAVREPVPSFASLHGGIRGGMVTGTLALEGIAKAMGMECPALLGVTGDIDTDLSAKARTALELLARCDFVLLHVGGTDEATHRKDPVEKAEFLKKIDRELLTPILREIPNGTRVLLTCDHAALCSTSGHTDEPVEALLYEKGAVLGGDLGLFSGTDAVKLLMQPELSGR